MLHLSAYAACILDESSSPRALRRALDAFLQECSDVSDIHADPSFDAWSDDALLASGVAINPHAAAHCVTDYRRTVTFIRGVHAAINALRSRFPGQPLSIVYAGCGPFATLLLPLLNRFTPGELDVTLLDVHQRSVDSVQRLLAHFGLGACRIRVHRADASRYRHAGKLHLVIAETMQKALEQEPQVAIAANLAPQLLSGGIFIPQRIEIELGLTDLACERRLTPRSGEVASAVLSERYTLGTVFTLAPAIQAPFVDRFDTLVRIPAWPAIAHFDAALFTHVQVYESYRLRDYESEITLPQKCHELCPLVGGQHYRVSYQTGSYPKLHFTRLD